MNIGLKRRQHLQKLMNEQGVDGCLFFHYTEISYFTSSHLGNFLFIPQTGPARIFSRKAIEKARFYNLDIPVFPYRSYKDLQSELGSLLAGKTLAVSLSRVDYSTFQNFLNAFSLSSSQIIDADSLLNMITKIKEPEEIEAMKAANQDIAEILSSLTADLVLHKSELELSAYLYGELKKRNFIGDYFFRRPIPFTGVEVLTRDSIYSSSNADVTYCGPGVHPVLAAGSGKNLIQEHVPFIIDIMQNTQGIHADVTRTFVVGTPTERLLSRYDDLLEIQKNLVAACQTGALFCDVYAKGIEISEKLGYKDHFMGLFPEIAKFVGHNLGAWVDEYPPFAPKISVPLEVGMTFALEPKFYFEDFDSPGLESNYLQTPNGAQCLTPLSDELRIL